jgi:hypothetical protein
MRGFTICLAILGMAATSASAETVHLTGKAAEAFIASRFPEASIPGPVVGEFTYVDKRGKRRFGRARCDVPAMGARSEGAVSTCVVKY